MRRRNLLTDNGSGGDQSSQYLTFKSITNCTHKFSKAVNYSLDGGSSWRYLAANTNLTVPAGSSVMWRATLTPATSRGIGTFSVTASTMRFDIEGNPMSLLYGDNFIGKTDLIGKNYAFDFLFQNNLGVVDAMNMALPSTTLAEYCYYGMFYACTSLTTAPELPATTLAYACYDSMFQGCKSLTTAPALLPATTLAGYCYRSMFAGCSSLTTATELPATTLAVGCYQTMFYYCTSLTTAPELPATTLAERCYHGMFTNCSSLTTAPALPVTTLASYCYSNMFNNCSSLTTAPELPATTLAEYCYESMFFGCTGLTTAPELPATTLANACYQSMFQGCKSLTTAPALLPATTLAGYCYRSMFAGCSSLTTATELPATTLAVGCYQSMFYYCTSLTTAPELPATTLTAYCYDSMFGGTQVLPDCTNIDFSSPSVVQSGGLIGLFTGTRLTDSDLDIILSQHGIYDYSLPVTTLAEYCYYGMFQGCTGLTTAPELPATTLAKACYCNMFNYCSSLNYIKCTAIDISAVACLSAWVEGVASSGTFVKASGMSSWPTGTSGIPDGWTVQNA